MSVSEPMGEEMEELSRRRFLSLALGCVCTSGLGLLGSSVSSLAATTPTKDVLGVALAAQRELAQGKATIAVQLLTSALKQEPENDFVLGLLGRAHHALGQHREAVRYFRAAALRNVDDTYSRMMVDMLTQSPLPAKETLSLPREPRSELERLAAQEEQRMSAKLVAQQGESFGYQVRRVVLDAGHGGFDSGAVGPTGLLEKDVNLALVRLTAQILQQHDPALKIFLSRTDDYYVPLSARTAVANQYSADLFVSFHANASTNRSARGLETYFCSEKASSKEAQRVALFENAVQRYDETGNKKLYVSIEELLFRFERRRYWQAGGNVAQRLQQVMVANMPMKNRGVHSANFFVLRKARMPSILLEAGFVSNYEEERMLRDRAVLQRMAASIASGILHLRKVGGV